MWMSSSEVLNANSPRSISDKTVSSPFPIASASVGLMMPCAASIAAWARLPWISWALIRWSNPIEAFIASMIASGPEAKRPPHMLLASAVVGVLGASVIGSSFAGGHMLLRSIALYTSLLVAANVAGGLPAAAGPVDWQAARDAGLTKLTDAVQPVPDVQFTDAEGKQVSLADWKGKALLVNFWATWCAPCREEMPSLDALQAQRGGEDFAVLTIAAGRNPPPAIRKFMDETGVKNLPMLTDERMALARGMGVLAMPVTILIDAEGNEVARMIGDADWASPAALAVVDQLRAK